MHLIKLTSTLCCLFLYTSNYTAEECFCQKEIKENNFKNSLSWICSKRAVETLSENERLKIGKNILDNGITNSKGIKEALTVCTRRPQDNATIIKLLGEKKAN